MNRAGTRNLSTCSARVHVDAYAREYGMYRGKGRDGREEEKGPIKGEGRGLETGRF